MSKAERDRRYREKRALRAGRVLMPRVGWKTALRWANSPLGIPPLRYNNLDPRIIQLVEECREKVPFHKREVWMQVQFDELRRIRRSETRSQEYKPSGSPAPPISAHILHDAQELSAGLQRLRVKKPIDN